MKIVTFVCPICGKRKEGYDDEKWYCCTRRMEIKNWPINKAPTVGVK